MEEKTKRFPLSVYEIVLLVILVPILFYYTEKLLWVLGESGTGWWLSWVFNFLGFLLNKPWSPWGLLSVLGFDCLWIVMMVYGPLKNMRIKIYATLVVFIVSAAILTMWVMGNLFRGWIPS
ncbi:MAG: hypothetical protein WC476_07855 [Phycisphaerae bacterium]|jgi:hypothetical protein